MPESLFLETGERAPELAALAVQHVGPELAVRPLPVARREDLLRQVEDDRDRLHVVLAGEVHQRFACLRLSVGGVDHGEPAAAQAPGRDGVEDRECVRGRRLIRLVVGHQAPAGVGGQDLRRPEVPAGEGRLAGAGRADEDDEGELGEGEVHAGLPAALLRALMRNRLAHS